MRRPSRRTRRHAELTPQLTLGVTVRDDNTSTLMLKFTGPPDLDRLDEVAITIRDDQDDRTPSAEDLTDVATEEFKKVIWGPYRLQPGVDGADVTGRSLAPFPLHRGEGRSFALEPTECPAWKISPENWQSQNHGAPVALKITCCRAGHEPWIITEDVPVTDKRTGRFMWV
jgi:hypothetical protein